MNTRLISVTAGLAAALLAMAPTAVFAHTGLADHGGFVHGFMHPMGGLDHILCMVAVGVFAYVLGGRALWMVPLSFVAMMVAGFALGAEGVDLPFVELAIGLSSVVIGAAAATGGSMPAGAAMALVGVFAVFHGHAHGAEMPQDAGGLTFALGFIVATALLHAAGIGAAMGVSRVMGRYGRPLARMAGGALALGGVALVAGWI